MGKRILSIVVGIAVAIILVMLTDEISGKMAPAPPNIDFKNHEQAVQFMQTLPLNVFITVLIGYALAAFAGAVTATLISGRTNVRPAMVIGIVLTIGGIMNLVGLPHPIWFMVINVPEYLVFAYLGYMVSKK